MAVARHIDGLPAQSGEAPSGGNLSVSTQPLALTDRVHTRLATAVAIVILAATVAALVVVLAASPPPPGPVPGFAYRDCPVADCSAYPAPSGVHGLTIATLQNWVLYLRSAEAEIRAARAWHVNTVRLQIVQDKMTGAAGGSFSPRYAAAVATIVRYALAHHLFVVLNAQTEISMGFVRNEALPTAATFAFWRHMAAFYGRNPRVVFDLFNEPRDCTWAQWRATMQPLVTYVRSLGARNELWVEGINWGSTLDGVPLLRGQGIVYSFHHPGSPWPCTPSDCGAPRRLPVSVATWDAAFGNLAGEGVPVVNGEFANFIGGYYWPRATQWVTRYFEYLHYHRIGVVAWSLQPGIMTATNSETTAVSEPQGAGRLFWRYFHGILPWRPVAVPVMAAGEGGAGFIRHTIRLLRN